MIKKDKFPLANSILLDSNNTVVSVKSSNGAGYYFRALIYINGQLFDEQSWSRKDNFTAEKDLKKLYNAYYEILFNPVFINGLEQQTHLIKKIGITINEYSIGSDILIQTQNMPEFYLMYNAKPISFTDFIKLQFLAVDPNILQIPSTGKLSVPFMVNSENEALLVELIDNFGNAINSQAKPNFIGKRVYVYNFDFSTAVLEPNTLYFTLKITVGTTVIFKKIRLFSSPKFDIKEIAFLNNFGYWLYAYLDGQLSIENNIDVKTYEELDGDEKIYEINEKQTYSINTGALLSSEKDIINQICTALEAKIYLNSQYIKMLNANKKTGIFKDRNNLYSENLTFTVKQNHSVENTYYEFEFYDSDDYDPDDYTT